MAVKNRADSCHALTERWGEDTVQLQPHCMPQSMCVAPAWVIHSLPFSPGKSLPVEKYYMKTNVLVTKKPKQTNKKKKVVFSIRKRHFQGSCALLGTFSPSHFFLF